MNTLSLLLDSTLETRNPKLAHALGEIREEFPDCFRKGRNILAVHFRFQRGEEGFELKVDGRELLITHTSIPSALRALSAVMGMIQSGIPVHSCSETTPFSSRGILIDTSRNGVPHLKTLRMVIRRMALMGLNTLYLYCEDTLPVSGEAFWGYFRGGYSQGDLKELDRYADLFGMEVVPCIQTLGHMEQVLQWPEYQEIRDTSSVMLAGDQATYRLIDKVLAEASAPFRSSRIHIGMDEAHGIGSGLYRQRNGPRAPFEILTAHLNRVLELCENRRLKPMIWSDMFFRLASKKNGYYDPEIVISDEIANRVPSSASLVYWDYYHADERFYSTWIDKHRQLGQTPVFATGIWTWNRFWAQLSHTFAIMGPGISAARKGGIDEVFAAIWGDDGFECDLCSAFPGLEFFAAQCFGTPTPELPVRFRGSCNADWESWCQLDRLDEKSPPASPPETEAENLSKILLWQDPILGHLEKQLPGGLAKHYAGIGEQARAGINRPGENRRLEHPAFLAETLKWKAMLHERLRPAYQARDHEALESLRQLVLPELLSALDKLHTSHATLWREVFRPFGWDVIDRRYGGLRTRLQTLSSRLSAFLDAGVEIPELDCQPLSLAPAQEWPNVITNHARCASSSAIA